MESVPTVSCGRCRYIDKNQKGHKNRFDLWTYRCTAPAPAWVYGHGDDDWVEEAGGSDCPIFKESDEQQSKVQGDRAGDT